MISAWIAKFALTKGGKFLIGAFPWIFGVVLVFVIGLAGYQLRGLIEREKLMAEEKKFTDFKAEVANGRADILADAAVRQGDNRRQIDELKTFISQQIAGIPALVSAETAPQYKELRSLLDENDSYDCLRLPYPASGIGLFRRPGGAAETGAN